MSEDTTLEEPQAATQKDYDFLIKQESNVSMPLIWSNVSMPLIGLCYLAHELRPPADDRLCMLHEHLEHEKPATEIIPDKVLECYRKFRPDLKGEMIGAPRHYERSYGCCHDVVFIRVANFENFCAENHIPLADSFTAAMARWREDSKRHEEELRRYEADWTLLVNKPQEYAPTDVSEKQLKRPYWGLAQACCIVQGAIGSPEYDTKQEEIAFKAIKKRGEPEGADTGTRRIIKEFYEAAYTAGRDNKFRVKNPEAIETPWRWEIEPKSFLEWCYNERIILRHQLWSVIEPDGKMDGVDWQVWANRSMNHIWFLGGVACLLNEVNPVFGIERVLRHYPDRTSYALGCAKEKAEAILNDYKRLAAAANESVYEKETGQNGEVWATKAGFEHIQKTLHSLEMHWPEEFQEALAALQERFANWYIKYSDLTAAELIFLAFGAGEIYVWGNRRNNCYDAAFWDYRNSDRVNNRPIEDDSRLWWEHIENLHSMLETYRALRLAINIKRNEIEGVVSDTLEGGIEIYHIPIKTGLRWLHDWGLPLSDRLLEFIGEQAGDNTVEAQQSTKKNSAGRPNKSDCHIIEWNKRVSENTTKNDYEQEITCLLSYGELNNCAIQRETLKKRLTKRKFENRTAIPLENAG